MFRFKNLFYSLLVCLGIIFILAISSASIFAADKPEIFVQMGHSTSINNVLFTSDGNYLVSGSEDRSIKIWEVASGKEIRTLRHSDKISAIAIAPDNQKILYGDEKGNITLWDWQTGKSLGKFVSKSTGAVTSLSFSPDGKRAISTNYGSLTYWDVTTKKQVFSLIRDGIGSSKSTIFLSDSNYIVMGVDVENSQLKPQAVNIEIYDVTKRKTVKTFSILKGNATINSLVVSPDKKYFLVSVRILKDEDFFNNTGKLFVVDAVNGNIVKEFSFAKTAFDLAFSPDGHYAAAATYGEVTVFNTKTWDIVKKMEENLPLAFSPDSEFLVCSSFNEQTYYGEYIVKHGLDIIDLKNWNKIRRFSGNVDVVTSSMFSSEDREILTSYYLLNYWEREKGILRKSLILKDSLNRKVLPASGNAFSADGTYAIVGNDNGSYIYNLKSNKLRKIIDNPLARVDFASDNKTILFSTYDRKVILWDVENNINIRTFADWGNRKTLSIQFHKLSSDGKYATTVYYDSKKEGSQNVIIVWDVLTGREVNRIEITNSIYSFILSPDGKYILTGEFNASEDDHFIALRGITNDRVIRKFNGHKYLIGAVSFSHDGKFILSGSWDQKAILWETESGNKIKTFAGHSGIIDSTSFSLNDQNFISSSTDGTTRLWNLSTGKEIAQFISFTDGEWIVITPDGYFNASPNGAKHLNVRVGKNVYGIDQFYAKFYRPELVQLALAGKEVPKGELITDIATKKPAPNVQIVSPVANSSVDQDSVTVTLKITDSGGGIGSVNIYLNGAQVANDTRGLIVKGKASANERILSFTIPLLKGQNEIRAVAFNGENSMESNPALISITSKAVMSKPNLYALVIGINTYKNQSISLTYAVPDATAFAGTLKKIAAPLFEKADIRVLTTPDATSKEAITKAFEEVRQLVKPNDLFIFYNASHGMVDVINGEEQYFLLTSNVRLLSSQHISKDALSHKDLVHLIGSIPSQKKLVILDTCNAGKGGKEIQIALLQQTRGLTDATAVKLLQRAVGSSVFSASADSQQALEGYKGHGLFTYVLLEGLQGKADFKKDGFITIKGLALHTEERVMTLSEEVFKRQQNPMIETGVNDFPIGKIR